MQAQIECFYCYFKQIINCMHVANVDEEKQYQVLFDLTDDVKKLDRTLSPAENTTEILLKLYPRINNPDPYKESKEQSNAIALKLYPELKEYLDQSPDRLYDALKISVAGNIIDLGISRDYDVDASLQHSLEEGFAQDHYPRFVEKLKTTPKVVIIGDNAGEIVFDRLLVEELATLGKEVIYIVKDGPVLNDATMEDARQSGIDKTARVITSGARYLGMPLGQISPQVKQLLQQSPVIISKGQANFETLEHEPLAVDRIFFLLKVKCACLGQAAGANLGDVVFFTR